MAQIPDDKVQEVRDRADIVDLVGRYVQLRRSGQNYKGLCPFHEERTPSFNVNAPRKGYRCFGCGASGDAIRFVMEIEGKSFPEAVVKLADTYGVVLPRDARSGAPGERQRRSERDEAYSITKLAARVYRETLAHAGEGQVARAYQERRGIGDQVAEEFQIGYAPAPSEAGWDYLARAIAKRDLSLQVAQKLGLVARSERTGAFYDRFRGRLMFPVILPGGEIVAFSGRVVPPHDTEADGRAPPKYLNSPESILFSKGKTLFGLHAARRHIRSRGRAILVEGNIDVVSLHKRGHGETVAALGTALTPHQAHLLARFCHTVILCFDGDEAGKKAAAAALPVLLAQDIDTRIVLLDEGQDPDSVEPDRLEALLSGAKPALEVMMVRLAARAGQAIDARSRALDQVLPLVAEVMRPSARFLFAERAAELFGFPVAKIRSHVEQLAEQGADKKTRKISSTSSSPVSVSAPVRHVLPLPVGQADLATLLVDLPHLANRAEPSGVFDCVTDERLAPIVRAVVEGAKVGDNPTMPELLDLVETESQELVHDVVFSGKYRDLAADPDEELNALVLRCREAQIEQQIAELDARAKEAEQAGEVDCVREIAQQRLELRRRQKDLYESRRLGTPTISHPPTS